MRGMGLSAARPRLCERESTEVESVVGAEVVGVEVEELLVVLGICSGG